MSGRSDHKRRTRSRRTALFTLATLLSVVLVTGCGGDATTTTAASAGPAPPASSTVAAATSSRSTTPTGIHRRALAFANCMRASGVPNFPDPAPGGGFEFNPAAVNRSAPAFRAAQEKCHTLMPQGGPAPFGSTTHPSAQTLAKLLHIAHCMRQHGIADFPDPRTSVPSDPFGSGIGVITDYDGAILLFPGTLNTQSPAYRQAAAACGTLAAKLGSGPHAH